MDSHTVVSPEPSLSSVAMRLRDAATWRIKRARKALRQRLSRAFGIQNVQWARVVMDRASNEFVQSLRPEGLSALEISGTKWSSRGFAEYTSASYPEYDVCQGPLPGGPYDVIIAEQVFEHILWPYRAVKNVHAMLKPNGWFIVTTPFLLRIHHYPTDCSRWTEVGMRCLLAEGGFEESRVQTGSWGNRACVRSNFGSWKNWNPWIHSLRNEVDFPVVVWAFAQKT